MTHTNAKKERRIYSREMEKIIDSLSPHGNMNFKQSERSLKWIACQLVLEKVYFQTNLEKIPPTHYVVVKETIHVYF